MERQDNQTGGSPVPDEGNQSNGEETRRRFLGKLGLAGVSAGLAHFLVLGGGDKAWATIADCTPTPDSCPRPSSWFSDRCSGAKLPDTCHADGDDNGDACGSGTDDSADACYEANPGSGYDTCAENVDNPDVCAGPPYNTGNGDECNGGYGDLCDSGAGG